MDMFKDGRFEEFTEFDGLIDANYGEGLDELGFSPLFDGGESSLIEIQLYVRSRGKYPKYLFTTGDTYFFEMLVYSDKDLLDFLPRIQPLITMGIHTYWKNLLWEPRIHVLLEAAEQIVEVVKEEKGIRDWRQGLNSRF